MQSNNISIISRAMLLIASGLVLLSMFLPIWRIELDAPQYPEGLALLIHSHKLGGDVEIINGLNHYIGMQTLHTENFIEFTLLPYIISAFALLILSAAIIRKKRLLYISFVSFSLFGVLAMIDFWRWNYNYGHNLDPHAAIVVPGMAYQPPLIGYKQLLNFGAYSIPDAGGWLFIMSGILLLTAVVMEMGILKKFNKGKGKQLVLVFVVCGVACCADIKPEPIRINKDNCDYCEMTIVDGRFGAEVITEKGRFYKFDDVSCLKRYVKENSTQIFAQKLVNDYSANNVLIDVNTSYFLHSDNIHSPMGGDLAAFSSKDSADKYAIIWGTEVIRWDDVVSLPK